MCLLWKFLDWDRFRYTMRVSDYFIMTRNRIHKNILTTSGFSLIELMVSLTIFSIIMMISIGTLLVMIDVNAKAQALYSSMTNVSFALDSMTRELRTGYHYYCDSRTSTDISFDSVPNQATTRDCSSFGNFITFTRERDGVQFGYRLNEQQLEQYEDGQWIQITSERDVRIDNFDIIVQHTDTYEGGGGNQQQPTIDVFIKGRMSNGLQVDTRFGIQTHIVERRLDII